MRLMAAMVMVWDEGRIKEADLVYLPKGSMTDMALGEP